MWKKSAPRNSMPQQRWRSSSQPAAADGSATNTRHFTAASRGAAAHGRAARAAQRSRRWPLALPHASSALLAVFATPPLYSLRTSRQKRSRWRRAVYDAKSMGPTIASTSATIIRATTTTTTTTTTSTSSTSTSCCCCKRYGHPCTAVATAHPNDRVRAKRRTAEVAQLHDALPNAPFAQEVTAQQRR